MAPAYSTGEGPPVAFLSLYNAILLLPMRSLLDLGREATHVLLLHKPAVCSWYNPLQGMPELGRTL